MKIAIIVRRLNVSGGTQRQALSLARELKILGHQVKLYTFLYAPSECYPNLIGGMEVVFLGSYPSYGAYSFFLARLISAFLMFVRENKLSRQLASLIDADTDILNPHDQMSYRVAAYFKKRVCSVPSVWMMNDLPTRAFSFFREHECNPNVRRGMIKKIIDWCLDWYEIHAFIKKQDTIIVLDDRDRVWAEQYFGVPAYTIRSGIDLAEFPYQRRSFVPSERVNILMNGILFSHRRFEDVIEAVALLIPKHNNIYLRILGGYSSDSPYYQNLIRLISEKNLQGKIHFAGRVSDEGLGRAYHDSDIFIFPSHLQSWGLAVFEAMACGLPVIVSRSAGAAEVLGDRTNALLVNPKSPEEVAHAVERLMDDDVLYARMSQEGRSFVEKNMSWSRYAKAMLNVFTAACKAYPLKR